MPTTNRTYSLLCNLLGLLRRQTTDCYQLERRARIREETVPQWGIAG